MKKKYVLLIAIFILFLNLGNILDLTSTPKKSDIIVVLGGGKDSRIKKGLELYKMNSSISKKIIFTGKNLCDSVLPRFNFSDYLIDNNVMEDNIINIANITNTAEELKKVKKYLLEKNFKSVLFVTHPTHTLRIKILANLLEDYDKENIKISFASADHTKVWSSQYYFLELESIKLVFLEYLKIIYNLIKYSIFL
jgi:uncharacterized SAM-binding protein YcdF (DUF218 family)